MMVQDYEPRFSKLKPIIIIGLALVIIAGTWVYLDLFQVRSLYPPDFYGDNKQLSWKEDPPQAPDYTMESERLAAWNKTQLNSLRGRTVLVNFWASWCTPCIRELPYLDALQAKYNPNDFIVVAVSLDLAEDQQAALQLWKRLNLTNLTMFREPAIATPENRAISKFILEAFPTSLILDKNGRIRATLLGSADWSSDEAKKAINWVMDSE